MRTPTAFLVLALLAVTTAAQGRVWIVDAANGAGAHFTDLPAAVAAAADGDTIIVRAGDYSPFLTGKGIAVVGQDNVWIRAIASSLIRVSALLPGQTFSLRNFNLAPQGEVFGTGLYLVQNLGRIHVQNVSCRAVTNPVSGMTPSAVRAESCREVTLTGCTLSGAPALTTFRATVVVSSSTLIGTRSLGLTDEQSSVTLSRTDVIGGSGLPAVVSHGSELIITGDASTRLRAGAHASSVVAAIFTTTGGSVTVDPNVVLQGTNGGGSHSGTATFTTRRIVSLIADGGQLGGPVNAEIVSPAGDLVSLLLSLPTDPIPTTLGTLYIDPLLTFSLVIAATQNPDEHFPVSFTFPNLPALRGIAVALQAANFYRATSFLELSNPVVLILDN